MGSQSTAPAAVRRLSPLVMSTYGFGQIGEALVSTGLSTFLLFYYNQVLGVSGALTGIALALSLVVDAVSDPAAGAISDRVKSRWARRHPFLLFSAVPLGAFFYLMFNPPHGLAEMPLALWLLTFTLLTRVAQTYFTVPYLALGAEMAHDYHQRSTLYSLGYLFATIGAAAGTAIGYSLFFPTTPQYTPGLLNPRGYQGFSISFAAVIVTAILVCAAGTWREIPHLASSGRAVARFSIAQLIRETAEAFGNRSFRALFFGMSLATVMLAMESVLNPYMGVHFWGLRTEELRWTPGASMLGLVVGVTLMPAVTRWLDKKRTLMYCSYVAIINGNILVGARLLHIPGFPDNSSPLILPMILATWFIAAILGPLIFGTLNAMFADIVDEHELEIGYRREGIIFAARSFLIKAVSAIGVVLGGFVIDWIHFPRGARTGTVSGDVLWKLGLFQAPLPSVFLVLAVMMYAGYRLDRTRHAQILSELAKSRAVIEPSG
jgi:glycoside/pentoside/hexuronide:cation symporter, GPH family